MKRQREDVVIILDLYVKRCLHIIYKSLSTKSEGSTTFFNLGSTSSFCLCFLLFIQNVKQICSLH